MKTVLIEDSARMQSHYPKLEIILNSLVKEKAKIYYIPQLVLDSVRIPTELKPEFQNGQLTIDLNTIIEQVDAEELLILCCSRPKQPLRPTSKRISVICPFEYKEFQSLSLKNLSTEFCILLNELDFKEFYASQAAQMGDHNRKSTVGSRTSKRKNSQKNSTTVDDNSFSSPQLPTAVQQQQQLVSQFGIMPTDLTMDPTMQYDAQQFMSTNMGNIAAPATFNQQQSQPMQSNVVWVGNLSWILGTEQSRMELICPCKCELATTQYNIQHIQPSNWPNTLVMSQRIFILDVNVQKLMTLRNVPIVFYNLINRFSSSRVPKIRAIFSRFQTLSTSCHRME